MPVTAKMRQRLLKKLTELFQLNQPDLDFGFYRIMHAKAEEVQQFLEHDLLQIISNAFGENDGQQVTEARTKYEAALAQAKEFGVAEPETSKPVQEAKAALDAARESGSNEAQVYDHLYRFFERYYDDGDFVSRRYYTRETASNAAPYAVPYNGEEVKLVWANMDQYYIKSTEYFNNFSFDLNQAKELNTLGEGLDFSEHADTPLRVHFKIITASEGEHGNIKASDSSKREFFLHQAQPVELNENNELVVNFEYRAATANDALSKEQEDQVKTEFDAKGANKGDFPNLAITSQILHAAKQLSDFPASYLTRLSAPLPTDKIKQRPLLTKYLNQYTSRNTMDYFIHKDLGGFLRRELDFYIKNEVMRLDDIENADAPAVESYLSKIKVLRRIAQQLIDFLAQLENFQKKLWLKKKFVTETNYCITLDRIPEALYPVILENTAQLDEWVTLFAINEIETDLSQPGFSKSLTLEFLKANDKLVLDTQFFDEAFKAQLLASIEDFDEKCNGLLIHSENFQALNLLQERYREQVKCVYIDPPYNTGKDGFNYKDSYQHSSWASMSYGRIAQGSFLQSKDSAIFSSIDDGEQVLLREILSMVFGPDNFLNNIIWQKKYAPSNDATWLSDNHDFLIAFAKEKSIWRPGLLERNDKTSSMYKNPDNDNRGRWKSADLSVKTYSAKNDYSITTPGGRIVSPPNGRCWVVSKEKFEEMVTDNRIWFGKDGNNVPSVKRFLSEVKDGVTPLTLWPYTDVGHNQEGKKELITLFDAKTGPTSEELSLTTPKPVRLLSRVIKVGCRDNKGYILDYFVGSGTTGHAVINLNREDGGQRKYILTEMGNHFDTVLKPRLAKIAYSEGWRDGKPTAIETGVSHCFKYIRLESYEDTLNNLALAQDPARKKALAANGDLKQDYMLNYMLDVETRGSQSLLNIDAFTDPMAYQLKVKKPSSDEYVTRHVDLIETFNYLIGLRLEHIAEPQTFTAQFKRIADPHASDAQSTRLIVDGRMQKNDNGPWWFRKVEGWIPADAANPNNGQQEKVLIVWRKLTGDIEQDNLMLDEWFQKNRISTRDFEFGTIYVNGSNNLPNLKQAEDRWKVRLIEEEFMQRMWDVS